MVLLTITNFAYALYIIVSRPFLIHINSIFAVIWCVILMTVEIFLIYFKINNATLLSSQKTSLTNPLLIIISIFLMFLIIWSVWRSVWQFIDMWNFFKKG